MSKKAISITLDEHNLLWLRARGYGRGSLSAAIDDLITAARAGRLGAPAPIRSVAGTIDLPADDPSLERADAAVRDLFAASLARPTLVKESRAGYKTPARRGSGRRRG